jgi:hypothetical protein
MEPGWFVSDSTGATKSRTKSSILSCRIHRTLSCRGRRVLSCRGRRVLSCRGRRVLSCRGRRAPSCRGRPAYPSRHGTKSTFSYTMKSIMIQVQIVPCYVELGCIKFRAYSCTVDRRLVPRQRSLRIPGAMGDNAPSKCLCIANVILQSTPHTFRQSSILRATTRLLSRQIQS